MSHRFFAGGARLSFAWLAVIHVVTALCFVAQTFAQVPDSMWIDVARIRFAEPIRDKCLLASTPYPSSNIQAVGRLALHPRATESFSTAIPARYLEQTTVLKFAVTNGADTTRSVYFTPGYYFRHFELYKAPPENPNALVQMNADTLQSRVYKGSYRLEVQPHEKAIFAAAFNLTRTNTNSFMPTLIESDFLPQWLKNMKHRDSALDTITYVICGILLLMIFYSLAVYLQNRNPEFIYYSVYAFCSAILLFLKSVLVGESNEFNFVYEEYLDLMILGVGTYFYLIFIRKFINTSQNHPFLERFLKLVNVILLGLLVVFSVVYWFTNKYVPLYALENFVIKIFLFFIGIVFITYSLRRRDPLLKYLAAGNLALLIFSMLSLAVIFGLRVDPTQRSSLLNKGLLYYELGVVLELMCFLMGLAYKNRRDLIERVKERERLKLQNERQEFEKQMAVMAAQQEERDRISADMHDELGSGVTAIRLMSEIVKTKMTGESFPELERISNSANDLLGKMNTIIWTMKSSNDSLESLVAYLRAHALEYFENTPIRCSVQVPENIPDAGMSGEKRRNIFLSVKEALNNALKHSQASNVFVSVSVEDSNLAVCVHDDGVGIDLEKLRRFGNGLANMKRRMESINGEMTVETKGGTRLRFVAPI